MSTQELRQRPKGTKAATTATGNAAAAAPDLLVDQPDRWKKASIRTYSSIVMVTGFAAILYMGPLAVVGLISGIQVVVFKEVLALSYKKSETTVPARLHFLNWYFFFVTMYFIYMRAFISRFEGFFLQSETLQVIMKHHTFVSFSLYVAGLVLFVTTLQKKMYKLQFQQFAWTFLTLVFVIVQSSFFIYNVFEGLIWFVLPCALVIVNDTTAFIFGFFFGRTPLIKLSPKKTWEGFVGATFSTVAIAFYLAAFLAQYQWMICPKVDLLSSSATCPPDAAFLPATYSVPGFSQPVELLPIQLHAVLMATFASIIAPFGGFFASGFKRAFKIKDFGESIPGHGGLTDRMDCQILMAAFSYVYLTNFVRSYQLDAPTILAQIYLLTDSDQLLLYNNLAASLASKGILSG